jgi:hypothetical protein
VSDDPLWGDDPRERDDTFRDLSRGGRAGSDPREQDHDYTLRGSETRTLTTVGAFRAEARLAPSLDRCRRFRPIGQNSRPGDPDL